MRWDRTALFNVDELRVKWSTDAEGNDVPPTLQSDYMDWMLEGPGKHPATKRDWAKLHSVEERSLYRWEKNPKFERELRRRAKEKNISPERLQSAVEVIYEVMMSSETKAADRIRAASLYIDFLNRIDPIKPVEKSSDDLTNLTDEELAALVARGSA